MNLIILFQTDFINDFRVKLRDRRFDHIEKVHRATQGDSLKVGLLNGKMGFGTIVSMQNNACEMDVVLDNDAPLPLPVTLMIAMPRPKVFGRILECISAMGVKYIYIMETWRVEKSYWHSPTLLPETMNEHCILGLEQACDTIMPRITLCRKFKPFVEDEIPGIIKDSRALVAHPASSTEFPGKANTPITLAIGPEGGFIPFEIELLKKQGFEDVSCGKRILRVEHFIPAILGRLF